MIRVKFTGVDNTFPPLQCSQEGGRGAGGVSPGADQRGLNHSIQYGRTSSAGAEF